jgi:hypothetical protein
LVGIESDQLIYDYLSQVGDLAQQCQLPSATRMRLVTGLREEIERQRTGSTDSPGAIKRILGTLGTPAEVVASAGGDPGGSPGGSGGNPGGSGSNQGGSGGSPPTTAGRGAAPGASRPRGGLGGLARRVPRPRTDGEGPAARPRTPAPAGPASPTASPPHLAGEDELGPGDDSPDWWRIEPGPFGPGESVPGFIGGIELSEMRKPPPPEEPEQPTAGRAAGDDGDQGRGPAETSGAAPRGRLLPRLRRRATGGGFRADSLTLFAALLVAGAALGSWLVLAAGWLLAYGSRRLSRAEAKWAVLGMPALVAAGAAGWLWGRVDERWGEPIPGGRMGEALSGTWPVAVRAAAVASAVFLVWRARSRARN